MVKYTEAEIEEMKINISRVGRGIPADITDYIWNKYREISGNTREPKPCTSGCPAAGRLWEKATMTIARYLDELEGNEIV
jgi:hypothetical protein